MRILYLTGREVEYPRNEVILRGLRRFARVDVIDCMSRSIPVRSICLLIKVLPVLLFSKYDLVYVGFYGHLLVIPIRWISRAPVVFDAFLSTYDTLVNDRKKFGPKSLFGRAAFLLDRLACGSADVVLVDTEAHREYFVNTIQIPPSLVRVVPVGCSEELFTPGREVGLNNCCLKVLFYCTYLPLHGVDTVVRAAASLKDEPISFELIGDGPTLLENQVLATQLGVSTISFLPPVNLRQLVEHIRSADVCLAGPFGATEKAARVIPGKLYQILAMEKPAVVADTPPNREILVHRESGFFCRPADPDSLADALRSLSADPELRQRIGQNGRKVFIERFSEAQITRILESIILPLGVRA